MSQKKIQSHEKKLAMIKSIKKNVSEACESKKSNWHENKSATARDTRERVPKIGRSSVDLSFT